MDNNKKPPRTESGRFKVEEEISPPGIDQDRFRSQFEKELEKADCGALSDEIHTDIQENLDELQTEMEIYVKYWRWAENFYMGYPDLMSCIRPENALEQIDTHGMTKGIEPIGGDHHLTLPQAPVHELRTMEKLTLVTLDTTNEAKSVGEIAEEMAALLRETLLEYLQDEPDESEPVFVEHARKWLEEDEVSQMETRFKEKLQSRIQYNLGSLNEKQYITRKPDPSDKRRTIIELTRTGELWIETHTQSGSLQEPINSILQDQVTAYFGVEEE